MTLEDKLFRLGCTLWFGLCLLTLVKFGVSADALRIALMIAGVSAFLAAFCVAWGRREERRSNDPSTVAEERSDD
jgi:hypothetical protein